MKVNLVKCALIAGCLTTVMCGIFPFSVLRRPLDEAQFLSSLDAQKASVATVPVLRDINVYYLRVPKCERDAFLYISNFASRRAFEAFTGQLDGKVTRFYLGSEIKSFNSTLLWSKYTIHQFSSKLGFSFGGTWSQKLLTIQIDRSCQSTLFVWDGSTAPHFEGS